MSATAASIGATMAMTMTDCGRPGRSLRGVAIDCAEYGQIIPCKCISARSSVSIYIGCQIAQSRTEPLERYDLESGKFNIYEGTRRPVLALLRA